MNALRCGRCDTMWHRCIDNSYDHGTKGKQKASWSYASWEEDDTEWTGHRRVSKSPRANSAKKTRGSTPRANRRKNKDKDLVPALDPPWNAKQLPTMPSTTTSASASTDQNAAAQQLQTLVSKLQTKDQALSPQEIQEIIAESTNKQVTSKSMHQAVRKVDQARDKFKAATAARQKLHTAWSNYVEESIKRWQSFAEDFAKRDAALEKEVLSAREILQESRAHLDEVKELHSKQDAEVLATEVISDGELDEDNMKVDSAEAIQKSIHSVVDSLQQIRVRPDEEIQEEAHTAKKPRKDGSALGSGALSPFPGPGK